MNAVKEVLIKGVPSVYAVGTVTLSGKQFYGFASELRDGKLFLVSGENHEVFKVPGCEGGVMAVIDDPGSSSFITVERFYPVFDSKEARLVRYTGDAGTMKFERTVIADVPYAHRAALLSMKEGAFLAVGRLCREKAFVEDWSTAGDLEAAVYTEKNAGLSFEILQDGIFKHHAMWVKDVRGNQALLYGGTEGVFRSEFSEGKWNTERLLDIPVSDIVLEDLDGDGEDELAVIEEFHGGRCPVFRKINGVWERKAEFELNFGHVLWGGTFAGEKALITGSRAGKKELTLRRFRREGDSLLMTEELTIDENTGPAQIAVTRENGSDIILASNHGTGEAVLYRLE